MTKKEVMELLSGYRKAMWVVAACDEECRMANADAGCRQAAAARLIAAKEQARRARERIEHAADMLFDRRCAVVIRMRYLHLVKSNSRKTYRLRRWRDITAIVHYGMSTVKRVHTEAIQLLMHYETL